MFRLTLAVIVSCFMMACMSMPVGNQSVPEPAKPVELKRYLGRWYELARYENSFETGCEAVTADYSLRPDSLIKVVNTCHQDSVTGPVKSSEGKAKVVPGSENAKLKVSFFGPFYGDYWVIDHADDYAWSIVGEPSGKYLWLLHRQSSISASERQSLYAKIKKLGYNLALLRETKQKLNNGR